MSQQSNLLLENKEAVCLFCHLFHNRVNVLDILRALLRLYIVFIHAGTQRTGAEDGSDGRDIDDAVGLGANTEVLCSVLCKLKDSSPLTSMKNISIDFGIIKVNLIWVKVSVIELSHLFKGRLLYTLMTLKDMANRAIDHAQGRQPKDIELNKSHRLQVSNVLTLAPWSLTNTT